MRCFKAPSSNHQNSNIVNMLVYANKNSFLHKVPYDIHSKFSIQYCTQMLYPSCFFIIVTRKNKMIAFDIMYPHLNYPSTFVMHS